MHKSTPQENSGTNGIHFFSMYEFKLRHPVWAAEYNVMACNSERSGTESRFKNQETQVRSPLETFLKSFRMEKHYRGLCSIWTCLLYSAGVTQATVVRPGGGLEIQHFYFEFYYMILFRLLPLVLLTPVANLPLVSLIPVVNFPPVSTIPPVYSWRRWYERQIYHRCQQHRLQIILKICR